MPTSDYIAAIRSRIGSDLLLLPGVTAVIRDRDRFLLARHRHSGLWSLIGGAVEPGEEPDQALHREVGEETGALVRIRGIVGVYGGESMMVTYPNGDKVGYVTTAYDCELRSDAVADQDELIEVGWFSRDEIKTLARRDWIDRVIADVPARRRLSVIRSAVPTDAEQIARVHARSWRETYGKFVDDPDTNPWFGVERRIEMWRTTLRAADSPVMVALRDGEIIGFASAQRTAEPPAVRPEELTALYVVA
ncbi:NUDIX hydrolase, partial [Microbacterium testaceum]|uniref:NUDIX hydrolase n=1 Tax=Microbacterium testaceum TaxID=2033 RepID=UPI000A774A29